MSFINVHWKHNHILSKSKELFNWQYKAQGNKLNFIVAKEGEDLLGILGYIKNSRYDNSLDKLDVIWLALWKVKENSPAGLGIGLYRKLINLERNCIFAVIGINKTHPALYKALGFKNFQLDCFFMVNQDVTQNILKHNHSIIDLKPSFNAHVELINLGLSEIRELNDSPFFSDNLNKKTTLYFENRYLLHPFYTYRVFSISEKGKCLGLISTRIVTYKNKKALRIVDFLGHESSISKIGFPLMNLLKTENIEYVDFWQNGIDENLLLLAGFQKLNQENDEIIIPNYFEPFLQENISILGAVKIDKNKKFIVCKADGDQDRPNILN